MQGVEGDALQALRVEEQVFCSSGVNESETLVRQFLNAAFSHFYNFRVIELTLPSLHFADCSTSIG
jgi:hypothetical protein